MAIHTDPAQLTDTIDPFESLRAGHPVMRTGLLAQARGGFLVVAMAERLPTGLAAALAQAIDRGDCGLVLLDESLPDEAPVASALVAAGLLAALAALTLAGGPVSDYLNATGQQIYEAGAYGGAVLEPE